MLWISEKVKTPKPFIILKTAKPSATFSNSKPKVLKTWTLTNPSYIPHNKHIMPERALKFAFNNDHIVINIMTTTIPEFKIHAFALSFLSINLPIMGPAIELAKPKAIITKRQLANISFCVSCSFIIALPLSLLEINYCLFITGTSWSDQKAIDAPVQKSSGIK